MPIFIVIFVYGNRFYYINRLCGNLRRCPNEFRTGNRLEANFIVWAKIQPWYQTFAVDLFSYYFLHITSEILFLFSTHKNQLIVLEESSAKVWWRKSMRSIEYGDLRRFNQVVQLIYLKVQNLCVLLTTHNFVADTHGQYSCSWKKSLRSRPR